MEGDYAYIADSYGGMEVINIANPNAPSTVGYCGLSDAAQGVHVAGEYAYIANYILGGVQVLFIGNPQAPIPFGWYKRTGCFAMNVTSSENHIYVADGVAGIQIYKNLLIQVGSENENIQILKPQSCNYPNPFNPETTIYFETTNLHENSRIEIFNIKGQKIKTFDVFLSGVEGKSSIVWDGKDDNSHPVSSGIYFYKIKSGEKSLSRKMVLLK